jgi:hypothetical protein
VAGWLGSFSRRTAARTHVRMIASLRSARNA